MLRVRWKYGLFGLGVRLLLIEMLAVSRGAGPVEQ